MAYTKTIWSNNELPAIDADNLNNIENGIKENEDSINAIAMGENLKGEFTPTISQEYPLAPLLGDTWYIQGLTDTGYTFTTGDTIGETANNFDKLIYSSSGWILLEDTDIFRGVKPVDNIAELLTINTSLYSTVNVRGYYTPNDGGGGLFNYDSTQSAVNNGGTIINGWVRQTDTEEVDIRWFGAVNDGATDSALYLYNACLVSPKAINIIGDFIFNITSSQANTVLDNLSIIQPFQATTINFLAMDLTRTGTIYSGNPYGGNLKILGASVITQVPSAIVINSQAAQDHRVSFTVPDETGFTTGGFAFVKNLVGTNSPEVLEGLWEITSVSANTVQCKIKASKATLPAITVTSGSISAAQTIFRVNHAIGLDVVEFDGGRFGNIALVGDGLGTGGIVGVRVLRGRVTLAANTGEPFGVNGFLEHGLYALENSHLECFDAFSSGNGQNGVYALDNSHIQGTRLISTGNDNPGLICTVNSSAGVSGGNFSGNGQRGIWVTGDSYVIGASCIILENGDSGVRVDKNSTADLDGAKINGSVTYGVRVNSGKLFGTIDYTGGNGAADEYIEDNGWINNETKRVYEYEGTTGATASAFSSNIVIDTASSLGGGITILTNEDEYGTIYFGNTTDASEGAIKYRGTSNSLDFWSQGSRRFFISNSNDFSPATDNTQDLGSASLRMNTIYAGTGTINTSDDREKTYLDISAVEKNIAIELKGMMRKFKFNDAIEGKGVDKARIHFGSSAQSVKAVFEKHGLKAEDYALLCYDEWEETPEEKDKEGKIIQALLPAGNRYGIRYEELLCFIIGAI